MIEQNHPWCRDVSRDEAIRRAEDAAAAKRTPLPDHRDLPAAGAELRERVARLEALVGKAAVAGVFDSVGVPPSPATRPGETEQPGRVQSVAEPWKWYNPLPSSCGALHQTPDQQPAPVPPAIVHIDTTDTIDERGGAPADGLRTERVTLEVTFRRGVKQVSASSWDWFQIVHDGHGLHDVDCVEVVEDATIGSGDVFADVGCGTKGDEIVRLTAERDAAMRERDEARAEVETYRGGVRTLQGMLVKAESRVAKLEAANAGGAAKQEPRGWLTAEERGALKRAFDLLCDDDGDQPLAGTVQTLLARSTPPRVKVPPKLYWRVGDPEPNWTVVNEVNTVIDKCVAAIRAAGGEVE